jgi:hypothetical protein
MQLHAPAEHTHWQMRNTMLHSQHYAVRKLRMLHAFQLHGQGLKRQLQVAVV